MWEIELALAYFDRGFAYILKDETTKAVNDLEKFIELSNNPGSGIFHFFLVDEMKEAVQETLDELRA
jgi:hypothetical protein